MLENILLDISPIKSKYYKKNNGRPINLPSRNRKRHGEKLKLDFSQLLEQNARKIKDRTAKSLRNIDGIYLQFKSMPGFDLKFNSLEDRTHGIKLLNVQENINQEGVTTSATVYIPKGKESVFIKKIDDYLSCDTKKGNPKNKDFVESIEKISEAFLDAFITTPKKNELSAEKKWYEIWLSFDSESVENSKVFDKNCETTLKEFANNNNLELMDEYLTFSERKVCLLKASKDDLIELLCEVDNLAEIRETSNVSSFFLNLTPKEQNEWGNELLDRIAKVDKPSVSVCILDSGINSSHPLVEPFVVKNGELAYNETWGTHDSRKHGTYMAGICLYDCLSACLSSRDVYTISHMIENGKILSNSENEKHLYGCIVSNVISNMIIQNPNYSRIYCMAVTEENLDNSGKPTSWSAAMDNITFGSIDSIKKLCLISAGNLNDMIKKANYPNINMITGVQNPGQSWNCLTIGGITYKENSDSLAKIGQLSPFSTTSYLWDKKWPLKPELVFEAGNVIVDGDIGYTCNDLSDISTEPNFVNYGILGPFNATSLATAKASNFAARLQNKYLNYWPETIRALMVHSASWNEQLEKQFLPSKPIKKDYNNLLRICGYGIPNYNKAVQCKKNDVNLIIQSSIQPFKMDSGNVKLNEYALFEVPWPKELLKLNSDKRASIKVTLSYFIESNPGELGWKDKYRYSSYGLRFSMNGVLSKEQFERKISSYIASDSDDDSSIDLSTEIEWKYGVNSRNVGSIHSDIWESNAGMISESRYVAIYPVGGWWKSKIKEKKFENNVRFSLVISLNIEDVSVDLYNEILGIIQNANIIEVSNNNEKHS